jgi:hypothetical protein
LANRDPARKNPIIARSHNPLAIAHQGWGIQMGQPWCRGLITHRNGARPGCFAHDGHSAVAIGQE